LAERGLGAFVSDGNGRGKSFIYYAAPARLRQVCCQFPELPDPIGLIADRAGSNYRVL